MAPRILVEIAGNASNLRKELKSAGGSMSGLGKAAGLAGAAIAGGLVVALKSSVSAAMDSQRVQAQTESQLKALGISYGAHARQIEKSIAATSKLAAIDDEELQGAFNDIIRTTGNVNLALRDTALAANVARGKHIELDAAMKVVTKAQLGSVAALKKIGIAISPVTKAVDALKESKKKYTDAELDAAKAADLTATKQLAISTLQQKFAGAAKAYGDTAAGAQDRMRVAVENLQESLGTMLLPIVTRVATAMANLAGYFEKHQTLAKALVGVVAGLAAALLAASAAQMALNLAFLASPVGLVVLGLAAVAAGLIYAYKHSETFRNAVNAIGATFRSVWPAISAVVKTAVEMISTLMRGYVTLFQGVVSTIGNLIHGRWGQIWSDLKGLAVSAINGLVSFIGGSVGRFLSAARDIGDALVTGVKTGLSRLVAGVRGVFQNLWSFIQGAAANARAMAFRIGSQLGQGIVDGIRSMLGAVKSAAASMIPAMALALKAKALISSPSRLFADEIGKPLAEGVIVGFEEGMVSLAPRAGGQLENTIKSVTSIAGPSWFTAGLFLGDRLNKGTIQSLGDLKNALTNMLTDAVDTAWRAAWQRAQKNINQSDLSDLGNAAGKKVDIPGFAGGVRNFGGGLAVVGERGPELVSLPRGSSVTPMGGGARASGGGSTFHFNFPNYVGTQQQLIQAMRTGLREIARDNPNALAGLA